MSSQKAVPKKCWDKSPDECATDGVYNMVWFLMFPASAAVATSAFYMSLSSSLSMYATKFVTVGTGGSLVNGFVNQFFGESFETRDDGLIGGLFYKIQHPMEYYAYLFEEDYKAPTKPDGTGFFEAIKKWKKHMTAKLMS